MGFTTPAFIRKNTLELRKKLEELGYIKNSPIWTDNCSIIWAYQYPEKGFDTPNYVIADSFDIPFDKDSILCGKFIDCGANEDLFLAIAALRDDTSANQYWVFDQDFLPHYKKGDFTIGHFNRCSCYCHVASVKELIEHFK